MRFKFQRYMDYSNIVLIDELKYTEPAEEMQRYM